MFKKPLTLDEYMDARAIADPIHLFDCVMPCAGGDGVLVMSEARARDLGLPFVRVLAAIERHNAWREDPIMVRGGWSVDREELYAMAGIQPKDLNLVQFYDDYPVIVMMQYEGHGLCAEGEGAEFVRAHTLDCEGTMPTNTSGGQLSMGQAGAAGGYLGLVEAVRQLTDTAAGRRGARRKHRAGQWLRHDHLRPLSVYRRVDPGAGVMQRLRDVQRGARRGSAFSGPHRGPTTSVCSACLVTTDQAVTESAYRERGLRPRTRTTRPATARGGRPRAQRAVDCSAVVVPAGAGPVRGTLAGDPLGGC